MTVIQVQKVKIIIVMKMILKIKEKVLLVIKNPN